MQSIVAVWVARRDPPVLHEDSCTCGRFHPYGRPFAPLRHHRKVVKVFLQLLVLPEGENDRDPVPVLITIL